MLFSSHFASALTTFLFNIIFDRFFSNFHILNYKLNKRDIEFYIIQNLTNLHKNLKPKNFNNLWIILENECDKLVDFYAQFEI